MRMRKQMKTLVNIICPDANANLNAAASELIHGPIDTNANRKCKRITKYFDVPSQIWRKTYRIPILHTADMKSYHKNGMEHANVNTIVTNNAKTSIPSDTNST